MRIIALLLRARQLHAGRWIKRPPSQQYPLGPQSVFAWAGPTRTSWALLGHCLGFGRCMTQTAEQRPTKNRAGPERASPTTAGHEWWGPRRARAGPTQFCLLGPCMGPNRAPLNGQRGLAQPQPNLPMTVQAACVMWPRSGYAVACPI